MQFDDEPDRTRAVQKLSDEKMSSSGGLTGASLISNRNFNW